MGYLDDLRAKSAQKKLAAENLTSVAAALGRSAAWFEKFLTDITPQTEVFGLLTRGSSVSFDRIYVQSRFRGRTGSAWVAVSDCLYTAKDPVAMTLALPVADRVGVVWGPAYLLKNYHCTAGKYMGNGAMVATMDRIRAVCVNVNERGEVVHP